MVCTVITAASFKSLLTADASGSERNPSDTISSSHDSRHLPTSAISELSQPSDVSPPPVYVTQTPRDKMPDDGIYYINEIIITILS